MNHSQAGSRLRDVSLSRVPASGARVKDDRGGAEFQVYGPLLRVCRSEARKGREVGFVRAGRVWLGSGRWVFLLTNEREVFSGRVFNGEMKRLM